MSRAAGAQAALRLVGAEEPVVQRAVMNRLSTRPPVPPLEPIPGAEWLSKFVQRHADRFPSLRWLDPLNPAPNATPLKKLGFDHYGVFTVPPHCLRLAS